MHQSQLCPRLLIWAVVVLAALSQAAAAKTICVNPTGSGGCYKKIQSAVSAAAKNDVIKVAPGAYAEAVVIGKATAIQPTSYCEIGGFFL